MLTEGWSGTADAMTFLFLAIGAFAAFSGAKQAADHPSAACRRTLRSMGMRGT
ncbi:hypothetical protein ABZT34_35010 [Streptomyces sp. NPDC005329]|uniref:hypothetical protein n=1 Tax=Streptomyces sp. NPDC005329 TaxID=3157034 RepID=UPI0033A18161